MTDETARTWWEEHQQALVDAAREAPGDAAPPFRTQLLALLDEVEKTFGRLGSETPGWKDPHRTGDGDWRDPREDEYSRCLDPAKHRILWTRAEAWTEVLARRGWAEERVLDDGARHRWLQASHGGLGRTTILSPLRAGALPLVLARTGPDGAFDSADLAGPDIRTIGLVIGIGDPAVELASLPDCGCDACDSGSRDLLEQLDTAVLSLVDGSCEVVITPERATISTSFGASLSTGADDPEDPEDPSASAHLRAEPWAGDWTPRPLCPAPAPEPLDEAWIEETLREPWSVRVRDAVHGVLPGRLGRGIRRRGTGRSRAYTRVPGAPVTVPLEALEPPPRGYRRTHRSCDVPGADFEQARSALRCWAIHRRAGLRIAASTTPVQEGTEVRLRIGIGPFRLVAPCRVVTMIDEPDRTGFAYATLPGHPESGIEEFTLTRSSDGGVQFHLDAVSRPAAWYARAAPPLSRLVQEGITRRYLRAAADLAPRARGAGAADGR